MTAKETVQSLYAAYAAGDPDRVAALLHPDVVWVAPAGNATQVALGLGSADDAGSPRGLNDLDRDAIVAFMAYDYPRYCFAYEVVDGRVTAIREYMDTRGGWLQVFGGDSPEVLMKGTSPACPQR